MVWRLNESTSTVFISSVKKNIRGRPCSSSICGLVMGENVGANIMSGFISSSTQSLLMFALLIHKFLLIYNSVIDNHSYTLFPFLRFTFLDE